MGMFAPEYKQSIPVWAKTVGVVTALQNSHTGYPNSGWQEKSLCSVDSLSCTGTGGGREGKPLSGELNPGRLRCGRDHCRTRWRFH